MNQARTPPGWNTQPKMQGRQQILDAIKLAAFDAKHAHTQDLKFEALDRLELLNQIFEDVTIFEAKLLADLDVD